MRPFTPGRKTAPDASEITTAEWFAMGIALLAASILAIRYTIGVLNWPRDKSEMDVRQGVPRRSLRVLRRAVEHRPSRRGRDGRCVRDCVYGRRGVINTLTGARARPLASDDCPSARVPMLATRTTSSSSHVVSREKRNRALRTEMCPHYGMPSSPSLAWRCSPSGALARPRAQQHQHRTSSRCSSRSALGSPPR